MGNIVKVPASQLSNKEETTNYCRIILLMVDVGTETLLHLFYSCVPKYTVKDYFASNKLKIDKGKIKKVFDNSQYAKLTCPDPNPDEFDISLLIKLLTYLELSPVKLDNLRTLRYKIVEQKHRAELITQEFQSLWIQVESILLNIARSVSRNEEEITKVKITELKEKVLGVSDREKKIVKIFEARCQEEIAVLHGKSAQHPEEIIFPENIQCRHDKVSKSQHPANGQHTQHSTEDKLHAAMAKGPTHECVPTDKTLADISSNIGTGWEYLAACLNVSHIAVEHIKADYKQSTQQQIFNMLLKWRNNEGCNATMTSLFGKMCIAAGVSIDWNRLQEMFGPVFDNDKRVCGTDDNLALTLQQDLIIYYRKELSKLQLSPLFEEEGFAADFFHFYVKPNITILSQQRSNGQSDLTPLTFRDIFNCKPCQNIYIVSPAGCGKTAFAKYLALIWCQAHLPDKSNNNSSIEKDIMEMRTFMFLFFVFLRDEHERECDVDSMIQSQLLPKLAHSKMYAELSLKFIQNLLGQEKCIIILDGLDEWSHPKGNECTLHNKQIPYIRARPLCTTVTTSRPWKLDMVRIKSGDVDQKLEINGLDDSLLRNLIGNVVKKLNELRGKKMQAYKDMEAADFEQELRKKKLTDLSKIPVVVMQLLILWFDDEPLGESQCEIYSNMIEFLLKLYCKKSKIVFEMEEMEVDDCGRDGQIPRCLQNNIFCKVHIELLSKLATLAYNTLLSDNKETSLVFDRRIAKKYIADSEIEISLKVGILTQEKVLGKMATRQSRISFIHKTFQEYLAALYVALRQGTVILVEEKIMGVCSSIEKVFEMSQIFMFLSGLCPEVMVNLHEHLRQIVSENSQTQRYRGSCKVDPVLSSEGRTLVRVQNRVVEWLGECWLNGHKHVTHLPVSDFFIWSPSEWSAALKSLTVHNHVCSLFVFGDDYSPEKIEDILNSVTVFNSIQALGLWRVSETFVVQLVSQYKHSLSASPKTWKHLECVKLVWVTMSGDILCSLVDSMLHVRTFRNLTLLRCIISRGTRDWKTYIRLHPSLTVEVNRKNVNLLQFVFNNVRLDVHISKHLVCVHTQCMSFKYYRYRIL